MNGTEKAPIRVACVGDSITEGTLLDERNLNSYPAQLAKLLGSDYEVRNFGKAGATVSLAGQGSLPYRLLEEFQQSIEFKPDIVIIKLGTNDAKEPIWTTQGTDFARSYLELVRNYASLPSPPQIILCRPVPVLGAGAFGIREENRQEILAILKPLAREHNWPLLNFDALMHDRSDLYMDPVHPNVAGTRVLAETIKAAVQNLPWVPSNRQ